MPSLLQIPGPILEADSQGIIVASPLRPSPYNQGSGFTASHENPDCQSCELWKTCISPFMGGVCFQLRRSRQVPATAPSKRILFIGEAPGEQEDMRSQPFIGAAGKILWEAVIAGLGNIPDFQSVRIYATNVLRCRPENNQFQVTKVKHCKDFLTGEIAVINPHGIVTLGVRALSALFRGAGSIESNRQHARAWKHPQTGKTYDVSPCLHPAAGFYTPASKPQFIQDVSVALARILQGNKPVRRIRLRDGTKLDATAEDIREFHKHSVNRRVALDVEANSFYPHLLGPEQFMLFCISFSNSRQTICVRIMSSPDGVARINHVDPDKHAALRALLTDARVRKLGHNIKYDIGAISVGLGISTLGVEDDTMLMHQVIRPRMLEHDLERAAATELEIPPHKQVLRDAEKGADVDAVDDTATPSKVINDWHRYQYQDLANYCALDARVTLLLRRKWRTDLDTTQPPNARHRLSYMRGIWPSKKLYEDLLIPALKLLAIIERNGIRPDTARMEQLGTDYRQRMADTLRTLRAQQPVITYEAEKFQELIAASSKPERVKPPQFNPNSVKQMRSVLFDGNKFACVTDGLAVTKTGELSCSEEALLSLQVIEDSPALSTFIAGVLEYRRLVKLLGTYIEGLQARISPATGRIHPVFTQAVTATGRLSCRMPNLQNIARDNDIKSIFVPRPGYVLVEGDLSQIELRILAAMSGDPDMIYIYQHGLDLHTETARKIFNLGDDEVPDKEQRVKAKTVNFGIVYLQSAFGLSSSLKISRDEADAMIRAVFSRFPKIGEWQEQIMQYTAQTGLVYSLFGRCRYIPDAMLGACTREDEIRLSRARRQAVNSPIQSTASDICLLGACHLAARISARKMRAHIVNLVHDACLVEVHEGDLPKFPALMRECMVDIPTKMLGPLLNGVPIEMEIKAGTNWGTMQEIKA